MDITVENLYDEKGIFIQNERIVMRKCLDSDRTDYLGLCRDVTRFPEYYDKYHDDDKEWEDVISGRSIIISIVTGNPERYVGYVNLFNLQQDTLEIGINLKREFRRQGYGTQAIGETLKELHKKYGINIMKAEIYEDNTASIKLFEKFGTVEKVDPDPVSLVLDDIKEKMGADEINRLKEAVPLVFDPKSRVRIVWYRIDITEMTDSKQFGL